MSTRCQIGYYKSLAAETPVCLIYKHNDGYPSDTLVSIAEFLKDFSPSRGVEDDEYLMAQLLVFLVNKANAHAAKYWGKGKPYFCGYGICGNLELHGDIEYLYKISPEGVQVWDVYKGENLLSSSEAKDVLKGVVPKRITD